MPVDAPPLRILAPVLALSLLACSGLFRSSERVEADIQQHLTARYGEPFVITRVNGQTFSGGRFPDKYNYAAHPKADPTLEFRGTADYVAWPDKVDDDYACAKIQRWLPDNLAAGLGDRHRVVSAVVYCGDRDDLPPHSTPNAPLPPKLVSLRLQVETFAAGDPLEVAEATRATVRELAAGLNAYPQGSVIVYPSQLWPYVLGILAEVRPDAVSTSVRARLSDLHAEKARYNVDVRVADYNLDVATLQDRTGRFPSTHGEAMWELRGIDLGPDGAQQRGVVCRGLRCEQVADELIDPRVLAPASETLSGEAP